MEWNDSLPNSSSRRVPYHGTSHELNNHRSKQNGLHGDRLRTDAWRCATLVPLRYDVVEILSHERHRMRIPTGDYDKHRIYCFGQHQGTTSQTLSYQSILYKPRPRNTAAITLKHSALLQIDDTPSIVPGDIPDNNRGTLQSW